MTEPQPNRAFEWTQAASADVRVLRCVPLSAAADHFFTASHLELRDNRDEWLVVARTIGVPVDDLLLIRQVHGAGVAVASADRGTPVWATADGTVESAGYNGNYGNSVLVSHGYGISTRFGHLSRYAVSAGQKVRRGQIIGYVGATGRATSSHLHYEILINGQPINPLRLLARP